MFSSIFWFVLDTVYWILLNQRRKNCVYMCVCIYTSAYISTIGNMYIQKLMAWEEGQFSRYWAPIEEEHLATTVISASHLLSEGSQVNKGAQHLWLILCSRKASRRETPLLGRWFYPLGALRSLYRQLRKEGA